MYAVVPETRQAQPITGEILEQTKKIEHDIIDGQSKKRVRQFDQHIQDIPVDY